MKIRQVPLFDIGIYFIVTIVCLLTAYPFLYIVSVSLSKASQIYGANITFYPKGINFEMYRYIFQLPTIATGYINSIFYTIVGTVISVLLTILCAYPLSKNWIKGRSVIIGFVIVAMFTNGGLIPTYILVRMLGLYNTVWALVLPGALSTFLMFVTITFFRGIPVELEEASYVDGADEITILTKIYIPLSKPIIAVLSLFYSVSYWNSWFPASIYLQDLNKYPIQLVLRNMMVDLSGTKGIGLSQDEMFRVFGTGAVNTYALNYALVVCIILPIIFVYPFVQKYFVKGVLIGSLKG